MCVKSKTKNVIHGKRNNISLLLWERCSTKNLALNPICSFFYGENCLHPFVKMRSSFFPPSFLKKASRHKKWENQPHNSISFQYVLSTEYILEMELAVNFKESKNWKCSTSHYCMLFQTIKSIVEFYQMKNWIKFLDLNTESLNIFLFFSFLWLQVRPPTAASNSSSTTSRPSLALAHKMKGLRKDVQEKISRLRSRSAERISNKRRSLRRSSPSEERVGTQWVKIS